MKAALQSSTAIPRANSQGWTSYSLDVALGTFPCCFPPCPALGMESTPQPPSLLNGDTGGTGTQTKMPLICLSLQTKAQIYL